MKREAIRELLPAVFRSADRHPQSVLGALLDVMESLHERPLDILDHVEIYFDPRRAPDRLVPFLGRWVDLDRFYDESFRGDPLGDRVEPISTGLGRLRELIQRAAYLSKWRGTSRGLVAFLETATGIPGFQVNDDVTGEDGRPEPFHIRVQIPEAARQHTALIEQIIESEKPAYVTYATQTLRAA